MSVDVKIAKKLDNNFLQVNVESDKVPTRYFKVPKESADSFVSSYKKFDKEESFLSYIKILIPTFLCCGIATTLAKNTGKIFKNIIGVGAGILGGAIAMPLNIKDIAARERLILKRHDAQEIYYLKQNN